VFLAALGLALVLNSLDLQVVSGVQVYPGLFAVMPLVLALGPVRAIGSAMLAMAPNLILTGQPFGLVVGAVEACWLVLGVRYLRLNAILVGLAFWLVPGGPLVGWLHTDVAGVPPDLARTIFFTRAVTGISAVTIGFFVLRLTGLGGLLRGRRPEELAVREVIFGHVFAVSLAAWVCVAVGFIHFARGLVESDAAERAFLAARDAARQTDLFFELQQSALIAIARAIEQSPAAGPLLLEETRRSNPRFVSLLLTDAEGRILQVSPRTEEARLRGASVADREYFRVPRETRRPFVSGVFRGRGFGNDVLVAMSVPLRAPDGGFLGVVEASVKVEELALLSDTHGRHRNLQLVLADAAGRTIFADAQTGIRTLQPLRTTPLARALATSPSVFLFTADRIEPDGTLRRVRNQIARCRTVGVTVIAQWPVLDALEGMTGPFFVMAAILGAIVGTAVLVSRAVHRSLSRPLEEFSAVTSRQAAAGEVALIAPPTPGAPREVGEVFLKFNALAERLNASRAELRRQNAELDRRVADRTRAAEEARTEAEAASRSKTEFLAMTSHEIRTPLNAIIGLAETVAASQTNPREISRLQTIGGAGRRLLGMVNDLIDLSRVEAGKLVLHPAPVELGALCGELQELLGLQARQAGLHLEFQLGPELPLWLETDGPRLQQVLINLIGNALKFTPTGGVTVRVERLGEEGDVVTLRLAVADTGPGISDAEQSRLFQPYVQVGDAAVAARQGAGLGLSISRRIVALFGGDLGVRSEPGRGAEFFFVVRMQRIRPPAPAPESAPATGSELRVLAVDDNEANREVLRGMLEGSVAHLGIVTGGREALALLAAERFDVALIDLEMPEMDGLEVARRIRSWSGAEASRGCRLVAFSAHGRHLMWERCAAVGFDDFAEKPVRRKPLLRALRPADESAAASKS
jgi:signal transduction histidine kinase/ActR/RegA family two-component response regulator